jgi:hypothetical protein
MDSELPLEPNNSGPWPAQWRSQRGYIADYECYRIGLHTQQIFGYRSNTHPETIIHEAWTTGLPQSIEAPSTQ